MKADRVIRAATIAYFSGLGYYSCSDYVIPRTEISVDVASIQPILKELKPRLKRGFAPAGIMQHLICNDWISLKELVEKTGFPLHFIASVLEEANQNGWLELDYVDAEPVCRNIDYAVPAKEAILTFVGTDDVEKKIDLVHPLRGFFNKCYFVFPYFITAQSSALISSLGCGIMKYIEELGAFIEIFPAEYREIEDKKRFALIAENILFLNIREKKHEII